MRDKVRVLIIVNGLAIGEPVGGAERAGLDLAGALDQTRFEAVVCGLWKRNAPSEGSRLLRLTERGIRAFFATDWDQRAGLTRYLKAVPGVLAGLGGQSVDVIHSLCQFGSVLAIFLRRRIGASAVVRSARVTREWGQMFWWRWLFTDWVYPAAFDMETGVSRAVVDMLKRRPGARVFGGDRIRLIYNGIDADGFSNVQARPELLKGWGIPDGSRVIGFVGRLSEQKGLPFLLIAAKKVLIHMPDSFFLVVGDGELRRELTHLAASLGIADHVVFTGARQDVEVLLKLMDGFVLPSLWEGLPGVILESMAAGVPVVATDIPGTREIVRHRETGYLVPPNDPDALAAAIIHVLKNREQAAILCEKARAEVVARFSIEDIAREYEELYVELLSS